MFNFSVAVPQCQHVNPSLPHNFPVAVQFLSLLPVEEKAREGKPRGVLNHWKWMEGEKREEEEGKKISNFEKKKNIK